MIDLLEIEPVHDVARMAEIEELQKVVWGFDARGIVPSYLLHVIDLAGGILLGAYLDGKMVGFAFGFLGQSGELTFHFSHMLGVHPDYQGRGIGEALKRQQREIALAQGLGLMVWAFDPLESRNAHFNLHKLGAYSFTY